MITRPDFAPCGSPLARRSIRAGSPRVDPNPQEVARQQDFCQLAAERQFHDAAAAMTAGALSLADSLIAQAPPDRPVSAGELARVEAFVVELVLKEAHAELYHASASPMAHALGDTVILDEFKRVFGERFRKQASLMLAKHWGHA